MRGVLLVLAVVFAAVSFRADAAPPKVSPKPPQTLEEWRDAATARLNAKKRGVRNPAIKPGKYLVVLRLAVLKDGRVVGVRMLQSSTNAEIDSAALRLVADVSPLPPLPPRNGFQPEASLVGLPITYHIEAPKPASKRKARTAQAAKPEAAAAE
ncbi:TonB family protein [Azorhizobium oxalatiphilum]|nr:TonB family protein [Azorhizobium oxalatiphilum]